MKITVKTWFEKKAQESARKYNWTLCWGDDSVYHGDITLKDVDHNDVDAILARYDEMVADKDNWEDCRYLCGEIIRETEKAVYVDCKYWNLNRAGRYVTDAPVCTGFKLWIPKSVILKGV